MENNKNLSGEAKFVTETLDTKPKLHPMSSEKLRRIEFGNSGFTIWMDRKYDGSWEGTFDFLPEASSLREKGKEAKYALIFCSSMSAFYDFLHDAKTEEIFKIDPKKIKTIGNISNMVFINSVTNFFNNHQGKGLVRKDEKYLEIEINAAAFRRLKEDHPLISYLRRISRLAKERNIMVTNEISS